MDEDTIIEFINILAEEGLDLDDLDLDEEELEALDVDDLNSILNELQNYIDDDEEDEEY